MINKIFLLYIYNISIINCAYNNISPTDDFRKQFIYTYTQNQSTVYKKTYSRLKVSSILYLLKILSLMILFIINILIFLNYLNAAYITTTTNVSISNNIYYSLPCNNALYTYVNLSNCDPSFITSCILPACIALKQCAITLQDICCKSICQYYTIYQQTSPTINTPTEISIIRNQSPIGVFFIIILTIIQIMINIIFESIDSIQDTISITFIICDYIMGIIGLIGNTQDILLFLQIFGNKEKSIETTICSILFLILGILHTIIFYYTKREENQTKKLL